jgi:hypothetical protein
MVASFAASPQGFRPSSRATTARPARRDKRRAPGGEDGVAFLDRLGAETCGR